MGVSHCDIKFSVFNYFVILSSNEILVKRNVVPRITKSVFPSSFRQSYQINANYRGINLLAPCICKILFFTKSFTVRCYINHMNIDTRAGSGGFLDINSFAGGPDFPGPF